MSSVFFSPSTAYTSENGPAVSVGKPPENATFCNIYGCLSRMVLVGTFWRPVLWHKLVDYGKRMFGEIDRK